jgi:hypothetical protein
MKLVSAPSEIAPLVLIGLTHIEMVMAPEKYLAQSNNFCFIHDPQLYQREVLQLLDRALSLDPVTRLRRVGLGAGRTITPLLSLTLLPRSRLRSQCEYMQGIRLILHVRNNDTAWIGGV